MIDPKTFNKPQLKSLGPDDLDQLGRALMALTLEVSILNDRLITLEDALSSNGISAAALVDTHCLSDEAKQKVEQSTKRIVMKVVSALNER